MWDANPSKWMRVVTCAREGRAFSRTSVHKGEVVRGGIGSVQLLTEFPQTRIGGRDQSQ